MKRPQLSQPIARAANPVFLPAGSSGGKSRKLGTDSPSRRMFLMVAAFSRFVSVKEGPLLTSAVDLPNVLYFEPQRHTKYGAEVVADLYCQDPHL
jgi:hypothetical protein